MNTSKHAKILGRRGGLKRAKKLSPDERSKIARLGAKARIESIQAARRIEINFKYLQAIWILHPPPKVKSVKSVKHPLPCIHEK